MQFINNRMKAFPLWHQHQHQRFNSPSALSTYKRLFKTHTHIETHTTTSRVSMRKTVISLPVVVGRQKAFWKPVSLVNTKCDHILFSFALYYRIDLCRVNVLSTDNYYDTLFEKETNWVSSLKRKAFTMYILYILV